MRQIRRPWRTQPQGATETEKRFSRGLESLVVGGNLIDARGAWIRTGAVVAPVVGPAGLGISTNGVDSHAYRDTAAVSMDAGGTILALLEPNATPATDRRAYSAATSANNDNYFAIGSGAADASRARVLIVLGGNAGTPTTTTRAVFEVGRPHCIALRWIRGVGVQSFVDGSADAFSTNTVNSPLSVERMTIGALGRVAFAVWSNTRLYLGACWTVPLSDAECLELTRAPWQLFAHRRILVPTAAATGPTVTALTPTTIGSTTARVRYSITY